MDINVLPESLELNLNSSSYLRRNNLDKSMHNISAVHRTELNRSR